MNVPKVSVCMPAYNTGAFLQQAIESLLHQTFSNFELLIIDDGSSDNTLEIAESFATSDSRVRVLQNEQNRGLVFTRNRLLTEARAEYIALADADDIFAPERLEKQVEFLDASPKVGMVGANVQFQDERGDPIREPSDLVRTHEEICLFLLIGPCIWNTVTMYRAAVLKEVNGYQEGFDAGAEDYDLWCRLAKITKLANLSSVLATVHVHPTSVTAPENMTSSNIFKVSQDMQAEYFQKEISQEDARDLVQLFWKGLGVRSNLDVILSSATELIQTVAMRESASNGRRFRLATHESLIYLANTHVYEQPVQSRRVMKKALALEPTYVFSPAFWGYVARTIVPASVRRVFRREPTHAT